MQIDYLFDVPTPLGYRVRTTLSYWQCHVISRHPDMIGREGDVQAALTYPDEIWRAEKDSDVLLFHRLSTFGHYIRVVTKRVNGDGFLITAFPCHRVKRGEKIWPK